MVKKIRLLFVSFLFAGVLFALEVGGLLNEYDKSLSSGDKSLIQKSYQGYKNIYIKSLLDNDEMMQKRALQGIIKSSQILAYDYGDYQKEYEQLDKKLIVLPQKTVVKPVQKPSKTVVPKQDKQVIYNKPARVRYVGKSEASVKIRFDRTLLKDEINNFSIKRNNIYADVYDFKAILPFQNVSQRLDERIAFKVAQNDKNRVRLVIESKDAISSSYEVDGEFIVVRVTNQSKPTKKIKPQLIASTKIKIDKTIVIDAGHGGKDVGAVYGKYYEKKGVLSIAKELQKELKSRGYSVIMTRSGDSFLSLRKRTEIANDKKADLFVSLHFNAAPKKSLYTKLHGVESYFLSPARTNRAQNVSAKENSAAMEDMDYFSKLTFLNFLSREKIVISNKLAIDIQKNLLSNLRKKYNNIRDGGVREAPFWVLVGAQMPAVLLEIGYITNQTERKRLYSSQYQKQVAIGIANGIDSFFKKNI